MSQTDSMRDNETKTYEEKYQKKNNCAYIRNNFIN